MATTTFTTWQALYESMQDAFMSGNATALTVRKGDMLITYRSTAEFLSAMNYAKSQAAIEQGRSARRVYAYNGGRA